jgi:hypothetical protein
MRADPREERMGGFQADDDVERLAGCVDEHDAARALAVPVEQVRRAEVQLLFERCSVVEAISALATCSATGDADGARALADAVIAATARRVPVREPALA